MKIGAVFGHCVGSRLAHSDAMPKAERLKRHAV
jgi:hypothetical protein